MVANIIKKKITFFLLFLKKCVTQIIAITTNTKIYIIKNEMFYRSLYLKKKKLLEDFLFIWNIIEYLNLRKLFPQKPQYHSLCIHYCLTRPYVWNTKQCIKKGSFIKFQKYRVKF